MGLAVYGGLVARNDITDNRGSAAGTNGIVASNFGEPIVLTRLERNSVSGFRNDGIQISPNGPHFVIARNRADFNGNYGIEGEPGVVDGGGNKARGNGNPLQCLNVLCK